MMDRTMFEQYKKLEDKRKEVETFADKLSVKSIHHIDAVTSSLYVPECIRERIKEAALKISTEKILQIEKEQEEI